MAFYSLDKINEIGAQYNFLLGGRGVGKTYAVIRQAIKHYIETGEPFAYIRRYKESIGPSKVANLCSPHEALIENLTQGEYNCVRVWQQRFWLELRDESGQLIKKDPNPLGFLLSLSTQDNDKGADRGFVRYIIFDEVIPRNGYLADEWSIFTNCISTLVRHRAGTTIYLLANPISKFCPYFDEMGIDFNAAKQGEIMVIKYDEEGKMKCAFDYIADNYDGSSSVKNEYFAFTSKIKSNSGDSIVSGCWEFDVYEHLPSGIYKTSELKRTVYAEFTGLYFACDIMKYKNVYYQFWRPATKIPEKSYYITLKKPLDSYAIVACDNTHPIMKLMTQIYKTGKVFYSTNQTGDYIDGLRRQAAQMKV